MPFPTCEDGYNKRKLSLFASQVVDDFKNIPILMKLKPAFPRYVLPGWYIYTTTGMNPVAGRIYYIPIYVSETTSYSAISMYVLAGSPGIADLRIFSYENGIPRSLILSAGTVDTSDSGVKEIPINLTLERGYYFVAVRFTSTPLMLVPDPSYPIVPPVPGFHDHMDVSSPYVVLAADAEYSDPAPSPTMGLDASNIFAFLKEC